MLAAAMSLKICGDNEQIMNPYNKPYGVDQTASAWSNWVQTNNDTLTYLRSTLQFKELVVIRYLIFHLLKSKIL